MLQNAIAITYGLIGFLGALSAIVFVWGFGIYIIRIGLEHRKDGIAIMRWGVALAITVVVVIGALRIMESFL